MHTLRDTHHSWGPLCGIKIMKMKILISTLILFWSYSVFADIEKSNIFKFSLDNNVFYFSEYVDPFTSAEKTIKNAEEVVWEILNRGSEKICYKKLTIIDISKFELYDHKTFKFLEDPITIFPRSFDKKDFQLLEVVKGSCPSFNFLTNISFEDKDWIEQTKFKSIRNISLESCGIAIFSDRKVSKGIFKKINNINSYSNYFEVKKLAEEIKPVGVIILGSCDY